MFLKRPEIDTASKLFWFQLVTGQGKDSRTTSKVHAFLPDKNKDEYTYRYMYIKSNEGTVSLSLSLSVSLQPLFHMHIAHPDPFSHLCLQHPKALLTPEESKELHLWEPNSGLATVVS